MTYEGRDVDGSVVEKGKEGSEEGKKGRKRRK